MSDLKSWKKREAGRCMRHLAVSSGLLGLITGFWAAFGEKELQTAVTRIDAGFLALVFVFAIQWGWLVLSRREQWSAAAGSNAPEAYGTIIGQAIGCNAIIAFCFLLLVFALPKWFASYPTEELGSALRKEVFNVASILLLVGLSALAGMGSCFFASKASKSGTAT